MKKLILLLSLVACLQILAQNNAQEANYPTNTKNSIAISSNSISCKNELASTKERILYVLIPTGVVVVTLALLTVAIRKRILFDS